MNATTAAVSDYLTQCRFRRFRFGVWDCALFVADVLELSTGRDYAAGLRGTYDSREGYLAALPAPLHELPAHFGLTPCAPQNGAVWWMPGPHPEGGMGIFWQGRLLQPGRRGLHDVTRDISTLTFYK